MNSQFYSMTRLEDSSVSHGNIFFLMVYDGEQRSYYSWDYLIANAETITNVVVMAYDSKIIRKNQKLADSFHKYNCVIHNVTDNQISFIKCLKTINFNDAGKIVIDISGMRAMHIFLLFKYLKFIKCTQIAVINTIPYDYIFDNEPFVSYSSYVGDLSLNEIIGYGGKGEISQDCDLYIFMGFEGALSLKVAEDIAFSNLYLVNTIPSYYQKYKDISLVNNYSILQRKKNKLMHVPADNPFEVYNMLDSIADKNKMICIAPLSTKPISLGICLYALTNENVRIVYPVSKEYNNARSHDIYISYVYEIIL